MVSTSMNSTNTNFSALGIKFVLVEFFISKFIPVEFSLCTTQLKALLRMNVLNDVTAAPFSVFFLQLVAEKLKKTLKL